MSFDLATVPTVGDTLVALEDLCSDLTETLKQMSDIGAELANKDYIGIDNAQEASCCFYLSQKFLVIKLMFRSSVRSMLRCCRI